MAQREVDSRIAASIAEHTERLAKLFHSTPMKLVDVAANRPLAAQVPGVYILLSAVDAHTVYAGTTTDQRPIWRRMQDHRSGNAGSDLPVMLCNHPDMLQDVNDYQVKWVEIRDPCERKCFEHFVIGVLKPPLNR